MSKKDSRVSIAQATKYCEVNFASKHLERWKSTPKMSELARAPRAFIWNHIIIYIFSLKFFYTFFSLPLLCFVRNLTCAPPREINRRQFLSHSEFSTKKSLSTMRSVENSFSVENFFDFPPIFCKTIVFSVENPSYPPNFPQFCSPSTPILPIILGKTFVKWKFMDIFRQKKKNASPKAFSPLFPWQDTKEVI